MQLSLLHKLQLGGVPQLVVRSVFMNVCVVICQSGCCRCKTVTFWRAAVQSTHRLGITILKPIQFKTDHYLPRLLELLPRVEELARVRGVQAQRFLRPAGGPLQRVVLGLVVCG